MWEGEGDSESDGDTKLVLDSRRKQREYLISKEDGYSGNSTAIEISSHLIEF